MQSNPQTYLMKIGDEAPEFSLMGTDEKWYRVESYADRKLICLIFTCNHCPYAQAYEDRIRAIVDEFSDHVGFFGINSNDDTNYPEDSFENMKKRAKERSFNFLYLRDATQEIARAYGAICTPHVFLIDQDTRKILYIGGIDDNWQHPDKASKHYLWDAIFCALSGKEIKEKTTPAIGCSIKWKE